MPVTGCLRGLVVDVLRWLAENVSEALLPVLNVCGINASGPSLFGRLSGRDCVGGDSCHCELQRGIS